MICAPAMFHESQRPRVLKPYLINGTHCISQQSLIEVDRGCKQEEIAFEWHDEKI